MKKLLFFITIFVISFTPASLCAQHLFYVTQNDLSNENVVHLKTQIAQSEISILSFTRNNEDKNVYSVSLSSVQNTKLIIMNEQTGKHVVITPVEESRTEFQLAPFFIEELRQGALGDATRYLIIESDLDFSVRNITSLTASKDAVYTPQFFYGKKEDVKEALPKDRQIVHIFKQKPRLILAFPDDPELQSYAAQYEEKMSYYIYMYYLPDGTLRTYDEHLNPIPVQSEFIFGDQLQFTYSGNLNSTQLTATETAFGIWGEKLSGTVPVKINIESKPLGYGILGQSSPMETVLNTGQITDLPTQTYYTGSLWNQLVEYPAAAGINIKLEMNSNFNFYYGTGNPPSNQTDWITVMLHEILHGLGFSVLCDEDGRYYYVNSSGQGYYTGFPSIFARQLYQGTSGPCLTELTQVERAALFTSNNLYAGAPGSNLVAAHGGRVRMYAPSNYQGGSSVSHWNNNPGFTTFMTPSIGSGYSIRTVSTREMGILMDMGWAKYDPNAIFISFKHNGGIGNMSQQQFSIGVAQNLKANLFTRTGYTFKNWNTAANGSGTTYQDKQIATFSENTELFAQWEGAKYTLTFNPGTNGSVNPTSIQVTYDKPIGELPVPLRPGYAFVEWRIESTTIVINEEYIWNFLDNQTATARWQMITHTITATATPGGTISSPGDFYVLEGSNKTYNIKPEKDDYYIADVLVDDESVGAVAKYIFENIVASHTIHAIFNSVGVKENQEANHIQIAPNPTTGELRIANYGLLVTNVEIFDVFGRKAEKKFSSNLLEVWQPQADGMVLDISNLNPGIYFLKIETEKGTVMKKVIKN